MVAHSIMQAKYMASCQCAREAILLRQLMKGVGCVQNEAKAIMCDNQEFVALDKNPMNHD